MNYLKDEFSIIKNLPINSKFKQLTKTINNRKIDENVTIDIDSKNMMAELEECKIVPGLNNNPSNSSSDHSNSIREKKKDEDVCSSKSDDTEQNLLLDDEKMSLSSSEKEERNNQGDMNETKTD